MGLFEKLFGTSDAAPLVSKEELVEAGACPNCWGKQNYDNQFRDFVEDQTKANINHDKMNRKAFIQQFVETNITGIRLKRDGDLQVCPACQSTHKVVSSKAN